jgi:glycine betaine/proline transport system substrate-binding protein
MTTIRSRRLLAAVTVPLLALVLSACSGEAQKTVASGGEQGADSKHVTIGYIAWDENIANSFLWKELLEKQGYTVDLKELEVAALYSGVAQGQLDVFMAATPAAHKDYWDRFSEDFVTVGQWYDTLVQGLAVPDYVEATSIKDLEGRANEFDGRVVGIEPGTGLMSMTHGKAVEDYDLSGYEIIDGSSPAMLAALQKALKDEEPIVVTLWQPHWAFSKFPIHLLEDPEKSYGENDVYNVIASKQFAENKEVVDQLADFHMEPDELQSLELMITDAGTGKEQEAVQAWIEDNQSVVEGWTQQG